MRGPKNLYFNLFNRINASRSIPALIKKSGIKIIFPFYHSVSDEDVVHIKHLYPSKNIISFINDLDFLLKYFIPLSIDDFLSKNYDPDQNYFVLSFDDGLRKMFDVVRPILNKKSIPAIFFLNSAFVDNKDLFYRYKVSIIIDHLHDEKIRNAVNKTLKSNTSDIKKITAQLLSLTYADQNIINEIGRETQIDFERYLKKVAPYMTAEEIKQLVSQGYSVGGHSHDHPLYQKISSEEQMEQTKKSMVFVEDNFPGQKKYFAFPFTAEGVENKTIGRFTTELKIDLLFGTAGLRDPFESKLIERIPMEVGKFSAEQIIKNEYSWYLLKRSVGKK